MSAHPDDRSGNLPTSPSATTLFGTPRANDCAEQAQGRDIEQQDYYRALDLARQLERELAEAKEAGSISYRRAELAEGKLRSVASHERLTAPDQLCQECHSALACIEARVCLKRPSATPTERKSDTDWQYEALHYQNVVASYGRILTAIKERRCTHPKPVGDSACDCCQHHWLAIEREAEDYERKLKKPLSLPSTQAFTDAELVLARSVIKFHELNNDGVSGQREHPEVKLAKAILRTSTSATAFKAPKE